MMSNLDTTTLNVISLNIHSQLERSERALNDQQHHLTEEEQITIYDIKKEISYIINNNQKKNTPFILTLQDTGKFSNHQFIKERGAKLYACVPNKNDRSAGGNAIILSSIFSNFKTNIVSSDPRTYIALKSTHAHLCWSYHYIWHLM